VQWQRGPRDRGGYSEIVDHNRRYWPIVFEAIAALAAKPDRALDIGCGTGGLTRELGRLAASAVGIDRDDPSLAEARRLGGATYVAGDFLEFDFGDARFDVVTSVASLHHMDAEAALARMKALLRPGGVMVAIGLARDGTPLDLARSAAAMAAGSVLDRNANEQERDAICAPTMWPPPHTYASMRRLAEANLPGVRYRRHLFWRYSLVWRPPAGVDEGGKATLSLASRSRRR
jgi:SAM-dependent methyltransferase